MTNHFNFSLDQYGPQKAMEVCETCGAFLVIGDPNSKIDIATANKIKKWQGIVFVILDG